MSPLDLPGPSFLLFYALYVAAVLFAAGRVQGLLEWGSARDLTAVHAYGAAYLRAGPDEALKVAVLALLDRGLLENKGGALVAAPDAEARVRRPLERAVLAFFASPCHPEKILASVSAIRAAHNLADELRDQGLLPSGSDYAWRALLIVAALAALVFMAAAKISVALQRGKHNIGLLLLLAASGCVLAIGSLLRRRTRRGDRALADLKALCSGLRMRADGLSLGASSYDLTMMIAVFGLGELGQELFLGPPPAIRVGADRTSSSSCSSSSCSSSSCSSSSCGSSCGGGGGCGGCGS